MHALALLRISKQTTFDIPSFTISKDMIPAKFKTMGHMTLTMPLSGV